MYSYGTDSFSKIFENELKTFCKFYCCKINQKWAKCGRSYKIFVKQNSDWLAKPVQLPRNQETDDADISSSPAKPGMGPHKPFNECSRKTKKGRVADLINEELAFADNLSNSSSGDQVQVMTAAQALALNIDLDLSERKYNLLRTTLNELHPNLLPSLYALKQEKQKIIPKPISASETAATVDLQQLMNCTASSIMKDISLEASTAVKLVCKWGFDGSSGHSMYKQTFSEAGKSDESLLTGTIATFR